MCRGMMHGDVVRLREKQTSVSSSVGWMVCREGSVAWMCGVVGYVVAHVSY